jgi:hypothetical protein
VTLYVIAWVLTVVGTALIGLISFFGTMSTARGSITFISAEWQRGWYFGWALFGAGAVFSLIEAMRTHGTTVRLSLELQRESTKRTQAEYKLELIKRHNWPRTLTLNRAAFLGALANKPTGTADILYQAEDLEAYSFARHLWSLLVAAGWTVQPPKAVKAPPSWDADVPALLSVKGHDGVALVTKEIPPHDAERRTPGGALEAALHAAGLVTVSRARDETLGTSDFRIVVGPKPPTHWVEFAQ